MAITQDEENRQEKRTWLSAVVFMDVVGYTKGSVERQIKIKDHMNSVVEKSVESVDEVDRIIVDSGDGAAICFLGDPEDSLFCAVKLRDGFHALSNQDAVQYEVCIGINLGPVKVVKDVNNRRNVLGDGINVAQRIMSFSDSGQILVSRSFYEVISCLSQEYECLFHYRGKKQDKHAREHTVYEFNIPENSTTTFEDKTSDIKTGDIDIQLAVREPEILEKSSATAQMPTPVVTKTYKWDPAILQTAEDELTRQIGPLAKILVKKIANTTRDIHKLYEQLGDTITDPDLRAEFLRQMPAVSTMANYDSPKTVIPANNTSAVNIDRKWDDEELEKIEHHLSEHLGPLSRILVKKASIKAASTKELYNLLADNLDSEEARRAFMKTMH